MKKIGLGLITLVLVSAMLLATPISAAPKPAGDVELVMSSWRTGDVDQWNAIIAAFNKQYPNIKISFEPTINTEYASVLETGFKAGTGPDLIQCYPFDQFLNFYKQGYLANVSDIPGLEHFGDTARSGWVAEDGKTLYCVPMASVIHGFYYNADMFAQNGWKVPQTMDEFHTLLKTIKAAGVTPIAMGTKDGWTNYVLAFNTIGVNMWDGENGRQALIAGKTKLTDPVFMNVLNELVSWKDYLPPGHEAITYADATQLFLLGKTAMWLTGSWEITTLQSASFKVGLFKNPVVDAKSNTCWIYDFVDGGIGVNTATKHPDEARTFLKWMTTADFATEYMNQELGFFTLSDYQVKVNNELVQTFLDWRQQCKSSLRLLDQFLSRGDPSAGTEAFRILPAMIDGQMTPDQAAAELQSYLWYPKK